MRLLQAPDLDDAHLIAAVPAIGLLLPERAHLERSTIVEASAAEVYPLVNDFRQFKIAGPPGWSEIRKRGSRILERNPARAPG